MLKLIPHWNWPGREGETVKVMALTNADSVSLALNGELIGENIVDPFDMVSWEVPYAPGKLEAIARQDGREVARAAVETTGEPAALQLIPDRTWLAGDDSDAQPITVLAIDSQGRAIPTASFSVEFEVLGSGKIIGLGNGDPNCHEPEKGNRRSLFNGLAQVIIQSNADSSGTLTLRAKAPGLRTAETNIEITPASALPFVPKAQPVLFLQGWRMSPLADQRPDPNMEVADNDMNTWPGVQPGELQSFAGGSWAMYRLRFQPFQAIQEAGGQIVFKAITGKAEIWLDRELLGRKETHASTAMTVSMPTGIGERVLSVLVGTDRGVPAGLNGVVMVEEKK